MTENLLLHEALKKAVNANKAFRSNSCATYEEYYRYSKKKNQLIKIIGKKVIGPISNSEFLELAFFTFTVIENVNDYLSAKPKRKSVKEIFGDAVRENNAKKQPPEEKSEETYEDWFEDSDSEEETDGFDEGLADDLYKHQFDEE